MNRIYRRQRHIYDLTRKYYLLGRDRLIDDLRARPADAVLEIGCGTGRNLIRAAKTHPYAHFHGIDISSEMLSSAREAIARNGLAANVRLALADATAFDPAALFGRPRFERIFISYSLSMIPDWRTVLHGAATRLTPRGELHIVDFGDQRGLPKVFRSGLCLWLARFDVMPCDELELELTKLAHETGAALEFRRPYRGYAQYAVMRRCG